MSHFFIYLLQVNIALAVFYLLYIGIFRGDTFFRIGRYFFLSAIVFALIYPFIAIDSFHDMWLMRETEQANESVSLVIGNEETDMLESIQASTSDAIVWEKVFAFVYIGISLLFILRFLMQIISILRMRANSECRTVSGIKIYELKNEITPFSFFNMIFVHTPIHSETELSQILLHEQTHARQCHSFDVVLIESILVFSWWNPFVWWMKNHMVNNLEFMADNGVLREGVDRRQYQYNLLQLTYLESADQIVNNFNVSQLKQRIMMMNKTKSSTKTLAKYLLAAPLALSLVVANSVFAAQNEKMSVAVKMPEKGGVQADRPMVVDVVHADPPPVEKNAKEVFTVAENMPEFPGGTEAMMKFLEANVVYPKEASEKRISGRVICKFVVLKDGSLDNVQVVRGVSPELDAEAIRVIKSMPRWNPGSQNGKKVNVWYTLPITFKLNENKKDKGTGEKVVAIEKQIADAKFGDTDEVYYKFLAENMRYPVIGQEKNLQGLVTAAFAIDKRGKVSFVGITKSIDASLDSEVKRVIEKMPNWTPANIDGEPMDTQKTIDVVFRLIGGDAQTYNEPIPADAIVVTGYGMSKPKE